MSIEFETAGAFVGRLETQGIALLLRGQEIICRSSRDTLGDIDRNALVARREEIIQFLTVRKIAQAPAYVACSAPLRPSICQELWWRWIDPTVSLTLHFADLFEDVAVGRLEQALRALINQHEVLRARFWVEGGELTLALNCAEELDIQREEYPTSKALRLALSEYFNSPLRASDAWLVRVKIFSISTNRHIAAFMCNHIVADGASIRILQQSLRKLTDLHEAASPSINVGYFEFANWQRSWVYPIEKTLTEHWRSWCLQKPPLISPRGGISLQWAKGIKTRFEFIIPFQMHAAIRNLARELRTSEFGIYLTIYALTLKAWSGQADQRIRSIADGRILPSFRSIVGLMSTSDAISVNLTDKQSFVERVRQVSFEYYAAIRQRSPAIYAFPPYFFRAGNDEYDQRDNVSCVFNYQVLSSSTIQRAVVWPPSVHPKPPKYWSHHVSPICLELENNGTYCSGAFLLHIDQLTSSEQASLMRAFFYVMETALHSPRDVAW